MDIYSPFAAVSALVAGVVFLRIFFTLWGPIDRKRNADALDVSRAVHISELKDAIVNVRFKSGSTLENVVLVGYCSTHHEAPYEFKQLLILRSPDGREFFARATEIEFFEQTPAALPPQLPPELPDPDAPDSWR